MTQCPDNSNALHSAAHMEPDGFMCQQAMYNETLVGNVGWTGI